MELTTNTFVEFLYPGVVVSESEICKITPGKRKKIPENAYAYRTFKRDSYQVGDKDLTSKDYEHSKWTYWDASVLTVQDIERLKGRDYSILLSNMRGNNIAQVVQTKYGQSFPYDHDTMEVLSGKRPTYVTI